MAAQARELAIQARELGVHGANSRTWEANSRGRAAAKIHMVSALRFAVRVKPGAKRDAVGGQWDGALGQALVVSVRAPAVDGKANDAVCRVLGQALSVRARDLTVVRGPRSRDKLIELRDAPQGSEERLAGLRHSIVKSRPAQ